jgi:transcriptional regulator NrdR family protein
MPRTPAARAFGVGITCPDCLSPLTFVSDSRPQADGVAVRRRRECANGHRFTTYEIAAEEPMVLRPGNTARPFAVSTLTDWVARTTHALTEAVPELVRKVVG